MYVSENYKICNTITNLNTSTIIYNSKKELVSFLKLIKKEM